MISNQVVGSAIAGLFTEAYEGSLDPSSTWFTNNEPNGALFGSLDELSAAQASVVFGQPGAGATVASHAEHLRWSLALTNALIRGEHPEESWDQSWTVTAVNDDEWDRLRTALRTEYTTLRDAMRSESGIPEEYVTPGIALIAHAAYHLGAIRQILRQLK